MALPHLCLSGTPYEQGLEHGRALCESIARNLAIYMDRFEREAKLPRAETLARAGRYAAVLGDLDPEYHAGMRGIADGSGLPFDAIAALNVRYELLYYQFGQNAIAVHQPDGCTAFAVGPAVSAGGHLLIGENWDWIPEVRGALVQTVEADGLTTLGFTEAGIFGAKIGLNSAGLGLLINGMVATSDDWSRHNLPFHARCRAILRSQCLDDATAVVTDTARPCAANFLIAQVPDRIVDIEAAPERVQCWSDDAGCFCHTNHFLDPRSLGVVEPEIERGSDSQDRLARMRHLLAARRPLARADLEAALCDRSGDPDGICRYPDLTQPSEERYATVVSMIMDLHALTLWISDGPPDVTAYAEYQI